MKITKLETFTKSYVSFVKVTIEDGSFGYGQMSTYHADITNQIFHEMQFMGFWAVVVGLIFNVNNNKKLVEVPN